MFLSEIGTIFKIAFFPSLKGGVDKIFVTDFEEYVYKQKQLNVKCFSIIYES